MSVRVYFIYLFVFVCELFVCCMYVFKQARKNEREERKTKRREKERKKGGMGSHEKSDEKSQDA